MYKPKQICCKTAQIQNTVKGHTFLGLNYRDTSLITLYLVVIGISFPKTNKQDNYITKNCC